MDQDEIRKAAIEQFELAAWYETSPLRAWAERMQEELDPEQLSELAAALRRCAERMLREVN